MLPDFREGRRGSGACPGAARGRGRAGRCRSPGPSSSRARIFSPRLICADLLDAVGARIVGPHQLHVVDDDQPEAVAPRLAPGPCSRRALARRSSMPRSEESSIQSGARSSSLHALHAPSASPSRDLALAQPVGGDPRPRGDEAVGELRLRHLEREEGDRPLRLHRPRSRRCCRPGSTCPSPGGRRARSGCRAESRR